MHILRRLLLGVPLLILGLALVVQTTRIKFVFGPSKMNVALKKSGQLEFIRGWAYSQIKYWDIYPSPSFPILAYFRESESYGGRGSIHFFPVVCDGQQLYSLLRKHIPLKEE
jgi:hypothetical protein